MSGGLYTILGVSRTASKDTIRLAYLRLAKQLHPDVNKSSAAVQNFQRVRDAYEVLSDDARRREHDRQLEASGFGGAAASSSSSSSSSTASREKERSSTGAPFERSPTYWEAYERARRAEQRTAQWHQRTYGGHSSEFARANSQYREAFNRERYQQRLAIGLFRMVPFLAPVWFIVFLMTLRRKSSPGAGEYVTFDSFGRAYVQDAYGRLHRMPDFDRPSM